MTVRQHHDASHAASPPNARAYRGAPRVSRTAKMWDTSLDTPTSHAISSRVSFRNSGGVVPLDLSDVRICVCSPVTRNACPSYNPSLRCIGTFGHGTPVLTAFPSQKGAKDIDI